MPDRYRLFLRFASNPTLVIVYVWFNEEDSLHKTGSKTRVIKRIWDSDPVTHRVHKCSGRMP